MKQQLAELDIMFHCKKPVFCARETSRPEPDSVVRLASIIDDISLLYLPKTDSIYLVELFETVDNKNGYGS